MTGMERDKKQLLSLLKRDAFNLKQVKLSSGKDSGYYIDAKQATLSSEGAYLTAKIFLGMLKNEKFDAIGGLTLGADPILGAIAAVGYLENKPVQTFIVRKEPKKHGMQRSIEGKSLKPGSRVIIIDDVMTSGSSALRAIEEAEKAKCKVVKVFALVDRLEGARENLSQYELVSIFTIKDFINNAPKT
ncbi:MAG: orotate phosphoribosyltransferase [Candidatus Omnitrophica bacterium]|nr:orotate phosphoribosyltransferase [Candidatus Omnitrophota bacterium]